MCCHIWFEIFVDEEAKEIIGLLEGQKRSNLRAPPVF